MAIGLVSVERDVVPARLGIEAPAEVRHRVAVQVVRRLAIVVEPLGHELGVEAALDLADEAARDVQSDLVVDVAAVRQDNDVARLQHDHAMRRALVGKRVHHAGAPVVEASGNSANPYCAITGYAPHCTLRSVPASLTTRMTRARASRCSA